MQRFVDILFFFPDSRANSPALKRAAKLAKLNGARLTLVNVMEPPPQQLHGLRRLTPAQLREQIAMEQQQKMEKALAPLRRVGVNVSTKFFFGTPFIEIIREVQRYGHDLVMLATESEPAGLWFGSTATHLMRKCPCPVWVLKPDSPRKYKKIMVAVDPDSIDPTKIALNRKLMELASSLARIEGSMLHIVHAWEPVYAEHLMRKRAGLPADEAQEYVSEVKQYQEQLLQDLLQDIDLAAVKSKVHLVKGDAGRLIPQLANRLHIEVIVMGTVCRTGIAGFFIGNTAEKVLQQVNCAVLAVKPNGFVSPVRLDG